MQLKHWVDSKQLRVFIKPDSRILEQLKQDKKPIDQSHDGLDYIVGFCVSIDSTYQVNKSHEMGGTHYSSSEHILYFINNADWNKYQTLNGLEDKQDLVYEIAYQDIVSIEVFFDSALVRKG